MLVSLILVIIVAVVIAVFTLANLTPVTVNLIFWEIKNVPLALVIIISVFLGILLVVFFFIADYFRAKFRIQAARKRKTEAEERIHVAEEEMKRIEEEIRGEAPPPEGEG